MTSSEQASGKPNTSSLLVNSHFCILETVSLLCFYTSQKIGTQKGNVQTRSVLDITSVEVLKGSMRRGGKRRNVDACCYTQSHEVHALIPLLNREQWRRTSCCFWTCREKLSNTHTHRKTAHSKNILGAQETLVSISFYTYA